MQWEEFRHKRVALLGAGIENLSLVPWFVEAGAEVFLCEKNPEAIKDDFRLRFPEVKLVLGTNSLKDLGKYNYLFRSPGMPIKTVSDALKGVIDSPIRSSAIDLFMSMAPGMVIGVTGTKGKGTTSTMIGDILTAAGKSVVVAGNIGKPIFTIFSQLTAQTIVVLELSSFQLEDVNHSPHIGVVLPISEDHLQPLSTTSPNFHPTMNDYVAAKAQITVHQKPSDILVFAADNSDSTAIASVSRAKKISVSQVAREADIGISPAGMLYHQHMPVIDLAKVGLRGQHLFLNAGMASAVAFEMDIRRQDIENGLKAFKPLPHRLEELGQKEGVRYVDDSYATAPDATMAALTAFSEPIVLIAGGSTKGADFAAMAAKVSTSSVKAVVLIGQEAPKIKTELIKAKAAQLTVDGGQTMEEAVAKAQELASKGDVILLSPGCASKDMFINAADRGDRFKKAAGF